MSQGQHTQARQAAGTEGMLARDSVPAEGDADGDAMRSRPRICELGEAELDGGSSGLEKASSLPPLEGAG
jgi:hypothetical protein